MKENPTSTFTPPHDAIDIIDVIRRLRNDLIKDFLDERNLIAYLSEQYRIMEISAVKMEFIKEDLKRQLIAPIDTAWYKHVIDDFHATGSAALTEGNEKLFYREIEQILKKHLY